MEGLSRLLCFVALIHSTTHPKSDTMKALLTAGVLALLAMTQAVAQDEPPVIIEFTMHVEKCEGVDNKYFTDDDDNFIVVIGNSVTSNEAKIIHGSDGNVLHYLMYGDWEEGEFESRPIFVRMALNKQTGEVVRFLLEADHRAFTVIGLDEEACVYVYMKD